MGIFTKRKPMLYYAHPWTMRGTPEEQHQLDVLRAKGFSIYEPFKGEEELEKKYGGPYYSRPSVAFASALYRRDTLAINRCQYVLAMASTGSTGTSMEIMYGYRSKKKIIIIDDRMHPFNVHIGTRKGNKFYKTFEEFEKDFKLEE